MDYLPLTKEEVDNLEEDVAADWIERLQRAREETGKLLGQLFGARIS